MSKEVQGKNEQLSTFLLYTFVWIIEGSALQKLESEREERNISGGKA